MADGKGERSIMLYAGLVIVFLLLAVIGSYAIVSMTDDHSSDSTNSGIYGYTFNFYNDQMMQMGDWDHQAANNGNYSGAWHIGTFGNSTDEHQWLIMTFVDYRLTPLYYNGSLETSHVVMYRSPVSCNISFRLTGLEEGSHVVTFFNVLDPDCKAMEGQGNGMTAIYENGVRFNVTEGNATKPEPNYDAGQLEKYVMRRNNSGDNLLSCPPWVTTEPFADYFSNIRPMPSGNATYYINATSGEDIEYYINVRNGVGFDNERYGQFAIMQLLDYEQQPVRQDTPDEVYFGTLNQGQTMSIHAGIKAPETHGRHILSIVWATWPYGGADLKNGHYTSDSMSQIIVNVE